MSEADKLLELGSELNKIRDRLYLSIYEIINELQRIASKLKQEAKHDK